MILGNFTAKPPHVLHYAHVVCLSVDFSFVNLFHIHVPRWIPLAKSRRFVSIFVVARFRVDFFLFFRFVVLSHPRSTQETQLFSPQLAITFGLYSACSRNGRFSHPAPVNSDMFRWYTRYIVFSHQPACGRNIYWKGGKKNRQRCHVEMARLILGAGLFG